MKLACFLLAASVFAQTKPVRVLFIGNSYTYYNEMPQTFAALAPAGKKADVKAITQGGASLGELWYRPDVRQALENERWDFVVLQEHSLLGFASRDGEAVVNEPDYFWHDVRLFEPDVRRAGATMVLYHTWSRKNNLAAQADLDYAYGVAATEMKVRRAPVGRAWFELRQKNSEIELYAPDGSHPSPAGSFVAACVIAQTIFEEPCLARSGAGEEVLRAAAMKAVEEARSAGPVARRSSGTIVSRVEKMPATKPTPEDFAGSWKGRVWMYREPAQFALELSWEGAACKGTWLVTAPGSGTRSVRPLAKCALGDDGVLEFTVQDWFEAAVETHRVRLKGDKLAAEVAVGFRTPMRRATGTWQASRAKN